MHERMNIVEQESFPSILDLDLAREFIEDLWEKGERPIVTVPEQFLNSLSTGLEAHSTWIPGVDLIAGTFGRKPYLPSGEKRVQVEVNTGPDHIHPRFTGPDKAFHGVVTIDGPIPPENIIVH